MRCAIATASWIAVVVEPGPLEVAGQRVVRQLRGDPAAERVPVARSAATRRPVQQRLVGHVQPDHRDRHAGAEHDVRRLGVRDDVELRRGGRVALPDRAAHQAQVGDLRRQVRVQAQQQRDVGERPDRRDRDGLRALLEQPGDQRDGALRAGPSSGARSSTVSPIPLSPWTSVARTTEPSRAPAAPSATGTSSRP